MLLAGRIPERFEDLEEMSATKETDKGLQPWFIMSNACWNLKDEPPDSLETTKQWVGATGLSPILEF